MPILTPKPNEEKDDYIQRCVADLADKNECKDANQRVAICNTSWEGYRSGSELMEKRAVVAELRVAQDQENLLTGYSAVYNVWSNSMVGFEERITEGAFDRAIEEQQDVRALWNHDPNFVLGRTKSGTLKLSSDSHGLKVDINPPDTQWAKDLVESVRRGDVDQMSFGFIVRKDKWYEDRDTGIAKRELIDVDLFDVSPVTYPAYPETSLSARDQMLLVAQRKVEHSLSLNESESALIMQLAEKLEDVDASEGSQSNEDHQRMLEILAHSEKIRLKNLHRE